MSNEKKEEEKKVPQMVGRFVLIKINNTGGEVKTSSGLFIPQSADTSIFHEGEVLSFGRDVADKEPHIKVGSKIRYDRYSIKPYNDGKDGLFITTLESVVGVC